MIKTSGTMFCSLLYSNSRWGHSRLKYLYPVISVKIKRLPGNTKTRLFTRSWAARVRFLASWAEREFTDENSQKRVLISTFTAYWIWSVISSFSNLNRWSSSLGLFYHVPLKRDQWDWAWRLRLNDTPNAIGYTSSKNLATNCTDENSQKRILISTFREFSGFSKVCSTFTVYSKSNSELTFDVHKWEPKISLSQREQNKNKTQKIPNKNH